MTRRPIGPELAVEACDCQWRRNVCTLTPWRKDAAACSAPPAGRPMRHLGGRRMGATRSASVQIEISAPRVVFAELLAGALDHTLPPPTAVAIAYLVDLLAERTRTLHDPLPAIDDPALLAALVGGAGESATARLVRLRQLGDAALFVAGFFGESLSRRPFGPTPTREAGRRAYGALATALAPLVGERIWSRLYEELADRFRDFADVLAEVGERCRCGSPAPLACLYARYLATESQRDRRRLLGLGALAPDLGGLLRPQ